VALVSAFPALESQMLRTEPTHPEPAHGQTAEREPIVDPRCCAHFDRQRRLDLKQAKARDPRPQKAECLGIRGLGGDQGRASMRAMASLASRRVDVRLSYRSAAGTGRTDLRFLGPGCRFAQSASKPHAPVV